MRRVHVHVDRLVLEGVRHDDRYAFGEGLQEELHRVMADRETRSNLEDRGVITKMRVAGVGVDRGMTPRQVGERVGQGIGREFGK